MKKKRRNNSQNKKKIKKTKISIPVASTSTQFLTNSFESLSDMEDDFHDVISSAESSGSSTKNSPIIKSSAEGLGSTSKPSPIIITDQNSTIDSISSSMNTLSIQQFSIKKISIGLKIFLSRDSDFIKYMQHIKDQKIEFYTHRNKSERVLKVVLSGLDRCDISTIQSGLDVYQLHPVKIFEMKTKNSNSSRALYLCHFKSGEITLRQLKQGVNKINHIVINWLRYQPKFKQITQCYNCYMFGHGSSHCNRAAVCSFCASSSHKSLECSLKSIEYSPENSSKFKCINCSLKKLPDSHRANDPSCPSREEFLKIRSNFPSSTKTQKSIIDLNIEQNFPELKSEIKNFTKPTIKSNSTNKSLDNPEASNMFSMRECFNIFYKAVTDMEKCQNKVDQMTVIAGLLQHAFE